MAGLLSHGACHTVPKLYHPDCTPSLQSPKTSGLDVPGERYLNSLHNFGRGMSFQVWGPGRQQFPGDDSRPSLLEHMAPASVLTKQQEKGQGIPPENHQHHQQDRDQEAGARGTQARVLGALTLRPGQTYRKREPHRAPTEFDCLRGCLDWDVAPVGHDFH